MKTEETNEVRPKKKTVTRILKWVLILLPVLIVLMFLLAPVLVSSESGRKIILGKINASTGGRADFADLSMGWLKGIKVADFTFDDAHGQNSIQVKNIETKPHYFSILMGNLALGPTTIDEPKIQVDLSTQQTTIKEPVQPVPVKTKVIPLSVDVLVVNDGNLKVTDRQNQTVVLSQINSKVNLRPSGQQTDFDIDMAVVDKGKESKISATGRINPGPTKLGWTLKETAGDLTVEVNNLDLESLAPLLALAEMDLQAKGMLSANLSSEIKNGRLQNLNAAIKAKDLDITGAQLKNDRLKTSRLNIDVKLTGEQELIKVEKLQVDADWLNAQASGAVPTTLGSLADVLKPGSDYSLTGGFDFDLGQLFSQMPHTFAVKEGMTLNSGKLSGNVEASEGKIKSQANLTGLAGTVDGKEITLSEPLIVGLELTADNEKINFDKLNVSSAFANVNASGSLEQVQYAARVDLTKLQSQLLQFVDIGPYQMAGELSANGQVSVAENKITAAGSSQVKNLRLTSAEGLTASEPMADVTFALDIDRQNNILTINSVDVKAGLGSVSTRNAVLPLDKTSDKPIQLIVTADELDLAKLQPFAVLFASFPQDMQLSGTAASRLSLTSEKGTYRIATDATKIKDLKFTAPGKEPFQQDQVLLSLDADINPQLKTINVKNLDLETPQIKIKKGEFKKSDQAGNTRLQGHASLQYDWAAVSDIASAFLPQGLKIQGQRQDNIDFLCQYPIGQTDKLMANLNTQAGLGFDRAEYMGLIFGPTDVKVQILNGLLKIAPFSTRVNNGQISFAGQADFKQKPAFLKTPGPIQIAKDINIDENTTKKMLIYVNPIFADAVNVSGVANFHCERLAIPLASEAVNQTEVIGTISITQLRLQAPDLLGQILAAAGTNFQGQSITLHPTRFALQDGFLRYDNMQIDVGDKPLIFKGIIGLDKSLDMTVTLPYTRGSVAKNITIPLKGTINRPQLDVGRLLEDQLKEQVEEQLEKQLRKGLEDLFK